MKTTIEISEAVLLAAQVVAAREGTTVRALVEEGLSKVVAERRARPEFRLRKVSFAGRGPRPDVRDGGLDAARDIPCKGRRT